MKRLGLLWIAVLIAGCGAKKDAAEADEPKPKSLVEVAEVKRENLRETLAIDGQFTLAEGQFSRVASTAPGRILKIFVKEGARVHRGELLAQIDTRVLTMQAQSARSGQTAAAFQAAQTESQLRAMRKDQESQVAIAKAALEAAIVDRDSSVRQAELDLAKIRNGARPEEVSQAQQALTQARIARDKAKTDSDRDARLLKEGYVSGQQADSSRAAYELAESALSQAQSQLELVRKGARPEERAAAEDRLRSARLSGEKRVEQARLTLRQAEQGIENVRAKEAEMKAMKASADQKASDAAAASAAAQTGEVRSPAEGYVSRRLMNEGDQADPAQAIFEIAGEGAATDFVSQVSPDEAGKIKVGAAALLEEGTGTVSAVGAPSPSTGLCQVRIRLAAHAEAGKFETVRVVLRELPNVLSVPAKAVLSRDANTLVFLAEGDAAKQAIVKAGPIDGDRIAILSGIKEGDKVILLGQFELTDGAPIEVKSS